MTSHYGNNYHYSELVESGQFAFVAAEAGDYMACFWAPDHKPQITLTIEFDWKTGVAAKDWSNVAKKGTVDVSLFLFLLLFFTFTCLSIYVFFDIIRDWVIWFLQRLDLVYVHNEVGFLGCLVTWELWINSDWSMYYCLIAFLSFCVCCLNNIYALLWINLNHC